MNKPIEYGPLLSVENNYAEVEQVNYPDSINFFLYYTSGYVGCSRTIAVWRVHRKHTTLAERLQARGITYNH